MVRSSTSTTKRKTTTTKKRAGGGAGGGRGPRRSSALRDIANTASNVDSKSKVDINVSPKKTSSRTTRTTTRSAAAAASTNNQRSDDGNTTTKRGKNSTSLETKKKRKKGKSNRMEFDNGVDTIDSQNKNENEIDIHDDDDDELLHDEELVDYNDSIKIKNDSDVENGQKEDRETSSLSSSPAMQQSTTKVCIIYFEVS